MEGEAWRFKASEFDSSRIPPPPYREEHGERPPTGQRDGCYLRVSRVRLSYVWPEDNLEHKSQDQVEMRVVTLEYKVMPGGI